MRYNYELLSESQKEAYLKRINFESEPALNVETLDQLIACHHMAVPFENIDIYENAQPVSLKLQDLFEKIIINRRGGYCFELNGLFVCLLRTLGFSAFSCMCRVVKDQHGAAWPIMHRGTLVALANQLYYCDVGFGGPMPCGALLLEDGKTQQICEQIFRPVMTDEGWWSILRKTRKVVDRYDHGGEERFQCELMVLPAFCDPEDFIPLSYYYAMNPDSRFRQLLLVNLRTETGYLSIQGNVFTVYQNGERRHIEIKSDLERANIFSKYFHLACPNTNR